MKQKITGSPDNDIELTKTDLECLEEGEQITVRGKDGKEYNIEVVLQ